MSFIKNIRIDCVQNRTCDVGHIRDDGIEDEAEVINGFFTAIDVMKSSDAEKVVDVGFQLVKKFKGFLLTDSWHIETIITDFLDTGILDLGIKYDFAIHFVGTYRNIYYINKVDFGIKIYFGILLPTINSIPKSSFCCNTALI